MAATKPAFNPPGKKGDIIFSVLVKLAALIVLLMLGGIIVSLIISSWPSIQKFGLAFLWTKEWDAPNDIYGALVPIYGTLVTSFIALLIAVPVSFGIALFLTELAPGWLKRPLGTQLMDQYHNTENNYSNHKSQFTTCFRSTDKYPALQKGSHPDPDVRFFYVFP